MSVRRVRPGPRRLAEPARPRARLTSRRWVGWALITVAVVIIALTVALTAQGRQIAGAVQAFLLYYAGVFALLALTAAVVMGLAVTDRMVMTPTSRVVGQAAHRILSLAALAALLTHIALEIIAHRAQVADSVVPFLAHDRTFFIGLGTLASDLILLIVVTSIWRGRFTGRPQAWRVIHVTAYLAWLMSILHGLLGGRTRQAVRGLELRRLLRGRHHRAGGQGHGRASGPGPPSAAAGAGPAGRPDRAAADRDRAGRYRPRPRPRRRAPRHRPSPALNRPGPDDEYPSWR